MGEPARGESFIGRGRSEGISLVFVVTTRNKLRSARFAPHMIRAWLRGRRQLYETPGMLRYTTGISNLTEFYTCTLWDTEMEMFAFMSSGAHRDMMWNFRKWSDSFWAMRWDQTQDELGSWDVPASTVEGSFASRPNISEDAAQLPSAGHNYVAECLISQGLSIDLREEAVPMAPSGTTALIARVPMISLIGFLRLRSLLKPWRANNSDLLRFTVAVRFGECFVIAVWKIGALEESRALMATLLRDFPNAWAMRCRGHDYEVGSWDNLKLGEIRLPADRAVPGYLE